MGTGEHGRPALPAEMVEGLERRRTAPAQRDDPAELAARLAELRGRVAEAVGGPPGGWETVSAAQAAHQLTGRGADRACARDLVADYVRDTAQRVGVPVAEVAGWGLDQGDIDAIARGASGWDAAGADEPADQRADELADGGDDSAGWSR
jgi:hypothetical protein